jgi:two-component system sensor histidine kinase UhpB
MEELLSLARQLRPTALDDLGLKAAIAGQVSELGKARNVKTRFSADGDFSDLDADVQLVLYRVAQEALTNAAQHSDAGSVTAELRRSGEGVELKVSDDGRGFSFAEAEGGLGLAGMRERALLVDGDVEIHSRPGEGTTGWLRIEARQPAPLPQ